MKGNTKKDLSLKTSSKREVLDISQELLNKDMESLGLLEYEVEIDDEVTIDDLDIEEANVERRVVKTQTVYSGIDRSPVKERDRRATEWKAIEKYYKKGTILESTVCAVEMDDELLELTIITMHGPFDRIIIKDKEFFLLDYFGKEYQNYSENAKYKKRQQTIRAMMGARISFILTDINKTIDSNGKPVYSIFASRVKACQQMREKHFFGKGKLRLKVGDIVEPRIISLNRLWVRMEVLGVECSMNLSMLSAFHWVKDCRKEYVIGEKIDAVVTKIQINPETKTVKLKLSRRNLYTDTIIEKIKKVKVGSFYTGEVIHYNNDKKIATVILHGNILCSIPPSRMIGGERIYPGDKVSVSIVQIDEVKGYCIGSGMKIRTKYD